jgi:hypothetical protein
MEQANLYKTGHHIMQSEQSNRANQMSSYVATSTTRRSSLNPHTRPTILTSADICLTHITNPSRRYTPVYVHLQRRPHNGTMWELSDAYECEVKPAKKNYYRPAPKLFKHSQKVLLVL